MRNLNVGRLALIALLVLAACGPSSSEMKGAKSSRSKGDKLVLFAAAKAATEAKYHLQKSDENALGMQTIGRWYTPEGLGASERDGDMRDVPDRSINIAFVVTLLPDGDAWVVSVKPLMMRFHAGSPKPEPLAENDASVPGWATGKVDQLWFDIHAALAQYEVKTLPGSAPPPAAAAPAAPAAPVAPAAPAQ